MTIKTRLIVFTPADNGNREDCSVFYSTYYLVTTDNPNLNFKEPIFSTEAEVQDNEETVRGVRKLGYTVEEIDSTIICSNDTGEGSSEGDDDDEETEPFNPWSPPK